MTYGSTTAEKKRHLLRTSTTPMGVKQEFTYDDFGNTVMSKTVNGTTSAIGSKTEYDEKQNYPVKSYDARGNAVTRSINPNDYTLTSVTDPDGQTVSYTYDAAKRVTGVETTAGTGEEAVAYKNAYTYENNRIKTVAHNTTGDECDVVYRFEYDALGRKTSVKVGNAAGQNQPLSTNSYSNDRSGLLEEVQYGNGGRVKYSYDDFDRLEGVAYDALGRIEKRVASMGENNYETAYEFVEGATDLYVSEADREKGMAATTPLVKTITQGSGENAMNFAYAYDNRGNIISETRNELVTHYAYDALGQLIRVDDPHEQATWRYYYDRGGNITRKEQYAWPDGAESAPEVLGEPTKTIRYGYDDPHWKDKLTSYDGKAITYDAIGNPLNDGVRTYTWSAARQLRHISMLTGEEHGIRVSNGVHEDSNTILRIVHDATNSRLEAKLLRDGRDVTDGCAASAFVWTKNGNAAGTGKEITVTDAEVNGDVQFRCTYTETKSVYGTVSVDNNLVASHTPATADANHAFSLENGMLKVAIPNSAGNGTDYDLADGLLSVNPGFTGTLTAEYAFTTSPTREIDFKYDHNGLRTQKKVVENGITTIYDYTLHGKLITHLTKRVVNEEGIETNKDELHFFYDAQSCPAKVSYNGVIYTYIHNLQGDIVGLLDNSGALVVVYRYDAWGKMISVNRTLKTTLGELNPFRYRGYVYDNETGLYYLCSRYYSSDFGRFINSDMQFGRRSLLGANLYLYCLNNPTLYFDSDGCEPQIAPSPSRPRDWFEQFEENNYFSPAGIYYRGEPNSHRAWQTPKGDWYERWYDQDGFPIIDRHWSDHGNPKDHPWVPHDEDWKDDGKGGKTIDPKSSRPSPPDAQKPTKPTDSNKISINVKLRDAGKVVVFVVLVGAYIFSGGMTPVPTYA